eukprot:scaffold179742_cov26-Prasinocladus_malaysianus.AAC.1
MRLNLDNLETQDVFNAIITEEMDFESESWRSLSDLAQDFLVSQTAVHSLAALFMTQIDNPAADTPTSFRKEVVQRLQRYGTYHPLKRVALEK